MITTFKSSEERAVERDNLRYDFCQPKIVSLSVCHCEEGIVGSMLDDLNLDTVCKEIGKPTMALCPLTLKLDLDFFLAGGQVDNQD